MQNHLVFSVSSFSGNINGMDRVALVIQEFEICFVLQFQVSESFFGLNTELFALVIIIILYCYNIWGFHDSGG